MESNITTYKDTTPAKPLDKATLNKIAWRSCMLQASFNYERMQAAGWEWTILPGLEKIHTNKEDLAASMGHNLEFFNTHPFFVTLVCGIVLSLEQNKADINTIRGVRVACAGPLGGIGDALFWFTLVPITAGITASMAITAGTEAKAASIAAEILGQQPVTGSLFGPILYFVILFGVQMALRIWLMNWSYNLGTSAITTLTAHATEFTHAASLLGVFVVGALTCNYGATTLGMEIPITSVVDGVENISYVDIQSLLNGILPALVPLLLTLMCYALIKNKGWSATKCIGLLLVLGIVGCIFGIWGGDYKALVSVPWHAHP